MLNLPQELFLISVREKKKGINFSEGSAMPYALAGAILIELILQKKIRLDEEQKVIPTGATACGVEELDLIFEKIRQTDKPRKLAYWVRKIGNADQRVEEALIKGLIQRGILKEEEKHILWVFPVNEYSQVDASPKYNIKLRLRSIFLGNEPPDERSLALGSLVRACDMLDHIFTIDEIKTARKRVNELVKNEIVANEVMALVDDIANTTAATMMLLAGAS